MPLPWDTGFGLRVMGVLGRTGLAPQRLELEITESALVRDLEAVKSVLGSLREAGVRIALDDFGTGYSSLYHLRNFKLDKIKIDRSFVDAMATDSDSAAIVRALVGLGAGLGLEVTAEGVETEDQRRLLADQGCEQGQGFLYSEAVTAEGALAMLSKAGARSSAVA
jgi:EAL domain-containing protein (putative c-di-GMP-specific phosphodiesterase class I)